MMRLDGEENARAQHEQLERNQKYRNPLHDFLKALHSSLEISRSQVNEWLEPNWMRHRILRRTFRLQPLLCQGSRQNYRLRFIK